MKTLGIDSNDYQVYAGSGCYGRLLQPAPTLLIANIFNSSELNIAERIEDDLYGAPCLFVDDGYDPVTRIRKGRIYQRYANQQPHQWQVTTMTGVQEGRSLATFSQFSLSAHLRTQQVYDPVITLGSKQQFTLWSLVDIEATVAKESVVYLKARKAFGVLPAIDYEKIIEPNRERVRDKIDTLLNEIHTGGPESVVDRCREALTAILSAYAQEHGLAKEGLDLSALAKVLENDNKYIVANLARTVAKFHSRGKHAEQERLGVRPLTEHDAELAMQAIGTVLYDLALAKPIAITP